MLWEFLTLLTAIFIGYLLISSILSNWDTYAAKKYLKEMVDKFGPSYTPKDWQRLKQETRISVTSFRIDKYEVKTHKLCFLFGTMIPSRVYPCVISSNTLSKMFFRRTNVSDRPCRCIIVIVIYKEARNVHNGCGSQEVWLWS